MSSPPGAGDCCCGKCCKDKTWKFNKPYYYFGSPNPWGKKGLNPTIESTYLGRWEEISPFNVRVKYPDGVDCGEDRDDLIYVHCSAQKSFILTSPTDIEIKVTGSMYDLQLGHQTNNMYFIYVFITACPPLYGAFSRNARYINLWYKVDASVGTLVVEPGTLCHRYDTDTSANYTMEKGKYDIDIYFGTGTPYFTSFYNKHRPVGTADYWDVNIEGLSNTNLCL